MNTGQRGEAIASRYLEKLGYEILSKNFRSRYGEIDLITQHQGTIIFVEVKTRSGIRQGLPCEAVNLDKQNRLRRMAEYYLMVTGNTNKPCRMDVVEIIMQEKGAFIRQVIDAF